MEYLYINILVRRVSMKKALRSSLVFAVVFAMVLFAAGEARAFSVGAGAGVYIPSEDVDKLGFPAGYSLNAHIDQGIFPMISMRLTADYSASEFKKSGYTHEFSTYGGGLLAIFSPPIPILDVYVGAGYSAHWFEYSASAPIGSAKGDDFGHGIIAQAGVGVSLFILNLGLNAQYYVSDGDHFDAGGYTVGIGVGVSI
jgi:hypothetical protein